MAMAMLDQPRNRGLDLEVELNLRRSEKHCFSMGNTLFEVDSKYVPIKAVGKGAYGVVCSSINTESNERVAIKKITNVFENRVEALRSLRELVILRCVRHENVIALKDVMLSNPSSSLVRVSHNHHHLQFSFKDVYMVYDLMDTDLHRIINSSQPLSNDHSKYFLFQLLRGLKYLHSANILHRDLKPGNLLVNANCDLKICDFGLARSISSDSEFMTEYVVTRWYRAPELLLCCDKYGPAIDVWSVGCIFAELLGRKTIFQGTDSLTQLKLIISILGTQPESNLGFVDSSRARRFIKSLPYTAGTHFARLYPQADPLAIDLLQKMLAFDPTKRITVTQALEHPYLSDLYDPLMEPSDPFPFDLNLDDNMSEEMIRELIWSEMLCWHPEEGFHGR